MTIFEMVRFLCKSIIISLFYLGFATATTVTLRTHCNDKEKIIFSCSFENKKTISICANQRNSLQYRYGVVGRRIELKPPASINNSYKSFSMLSSGSGKWHDRKINFKINDFSYSILSYENINIPEEEFSISIFKNQKKLNT